MNNKKSYICKSIFDFIKIKRNLIYVYQNFKIGRNQRRFNIPLWGAMMPCHYTIENPQRRHQAYIGDYLNEEIRAEDLLAHLGRL
jgi:hypothetical protein